ncbi:THAP domain-containing protein 2-like [Oratosquilla oratoria]|uniref:THAP domain-containing protein 2-like n=1 Tax=Oratosquilla oratoria TaxID=337810 RepID=UPI003F76E4F9
MPSHCAVSGCRKTHVEGSEITYHRFPKDEYVRNKWITFCKRTERFNPANSYICSLHFEANAFQRHLKYELLGIPVPTSQKKFKPGAVPTLYYGGTLTYIIEIRKCDESRGKLVLLDPLSRLLAGNVLKPMHGFNPAKYSPVNAIESGY